jgi:hypothetical protein
VADVIGQLVPLSIAQGISGTTAARSPGHRLGHAHQIAQGISETVVAAFPLDDLIVQVLSILTMNNHGRTGERQTGIPKIINSDPGMPSGMPSLNVICRHRLIHHVRDPKCYLLLCIALMC